MVPKRPHPLFSALILTPQSYTPPRPQYQSKPYSAITTTKHPLLNTETTPKKSTFINTGCIITVAKTTAKTAAIPTPSVPSTPTPPATPQLPPTSVHKPTFQYPTSCSSTSPSDLGSIHPPPPSPYLCHPRSHPPPSFPTFFRISSGWDSRELSYHLHNNNQRRLPSHGTSEGTTYTFKINQK